MALTAYGQFQKNLSLKSVSPPELLARLFLKAAGQMGEIIDAIHENDIEKRYLISQKVSDFFSQMASYLDMGTSPEQQQAYKILKTYCGGTNILLSRMNFKNDGAIALAIQDSLIKSAQVLRHMAGEHARREMAEMGEKPEFTLENKIPMGFSA